MFAVEYKAEAKGLFEDPCLYWYHDGNQFVYAEGPRTLYSTREEAEGGILWVIAVKGLHYMGDVLKVVEVKSG